MERDRIARLVLACLCMAACTEERGVVVVERALVTDRLAVRGSDLYWATEGGIDGVWRLSPGGEPVRIADAQGERVAVDDTHAYWFAATAGQIQRAPLAGGDVDVVAAGLGDESSFVLGEKRVLVVDAGPLANGRVLSVRKDGGDLRVEAPDIGTAGFWACPVVWRDRMIWAGEGGLLSIPLAGGPVDTFWPFEIGMCSLAADETGVYFASGDDVMWINRDDQRSIAGEEHWAKSVIPRGAYVYWISTCEDGGDVMVRRAPKAGGATETLAVGDTIVYDLVAADDGSLYWSDGDWLIRSLRPL